MSQNTENFESLRRLLSLKRHEQPPPGYFNNFSSQVIARIKLGEMGEERSIPGSVLWEAPWLQRLWAALEAKPIVAGAVAVAVCGLLITGAIYPEDKDPGQVAAISVSESTPLPVEVANATTVMTPANHPLLAKPAALEGEFMGSLRAQPVGFTFPGGN